MEAGWKKKHFQAWNNPTPGFESAIVRLVQAVDEYDFAYSKEYGEEVEDYSYRSDAVHKDSYCGPHFADIVRGIRGLLSGPTGEPQRLDAGTLDAILVSLLPPEEQ